jgi:hypothetical protein
MNSSELMDHIRSGPAELVLHEPLRFRRRKRSHLCGFNEFLQALGSSETIRSVYCHPHRDLNISEDEWLRLVKTLGKIKGIQHLAVYCLEGDWYYHPFQAIADAENSAQSLLILKVLPSYRVLFLNQYG